MTQLLLLQHLQSLLCMIIQKCFPIDIWQRALEPWRQDLFFRGLLRFWTTFCLISYQSGHHFRINSACQSHVKRWGTVTLFWLLSAALYCSLSLYPVKRHLLFCLVSMDTHVIRPRHHRTLHISVVSSLKPRKDRGNPADQPHPCLKASCFAVTFVLYFSMTQQVHVKRIQNHWSTATGDRTLLSAHL